MGREIVTESDTVENLGAPSSPGPSSDQGSFSTPGKEAPYAQRGLPRLSPRPDDYGARLLKYIPAEIVAVYLTLDRIANSATGQLPIEPTLWTVFLILVIATPLFLWRVTNVRKGSQLAISTASFAVWVFAMGGPFYYLAWYRPIEGAITLPLYTFLVPIFKGGPTATQRVRNRRPSRR